MAGKGAGEQSLARKLCRRLDEDWLLIAGRNFYGWAEWCAAADCGAALLWRVKAGLTLPYRSVLVNPKTGGKARQQLIEAARAGDDWTVPARPSPRDRRPPRGTVCSPRCRV